jgi:hypothetical protein
MLEVPPGGHPLLKTPVRFLLGQMSRRGIPIRSWRAPVESLRLRLDRGDGPRSVHAGAMRNLGVAMATRVSVASRAGVADQAPTHGGGEMDDMMGRLDALQSTLASLVGRVSIMEVVTKSHTDMAAAMWSV